MNCPRCNKPLSKKNKCDRCGDNANVYIKIIMASNMYYNDGLRRANVRDLTGAITSLKESLKLNKKNTSARNLLGLIYYEMGETVAALSEWVISKHFQSENNDADEYMNAVQSNPTKLETINQAIKKYNSALLSTKQGNDDLAIIQLKKVLSLNPHFIRANQLLGLLYIKSNEIEKARKCLAKASKIDVANTKTLKYLQAINESSITREEVEAGKKNNRRDQRTDTSSSIIPISSYKEDKPNFIAFINLILGVLIGIAVVYFLIVPTIRQNIKNELNSSIIDYSEQMNNQVTSIESLEKSNVELQSTIDEQQKQIANLENSQLDETTYDNLFLALQLFLEGDKEKAAQKLLEVNVKKLERPATQELYQLIKNDTFTKLSTDFYNQGYSSYSKGKYDDALDALLKSIEFDATNVDAIYFLARTYHRQNEDEKAKEYYNLIVKDFPESKRATEAKSRLNGID